MSEHHPEDPRLNPVHFPPARHFCVRIKPGALAVVLAVAVAAFVAALAHYLVAGLPAAPDAGVPPSHEAFGPPGFPAWLRLAHYVNLLFLVLLARSGVSILMDHPRLYWNDHSTPGSDWLRFTPTDVPTD